MFCNSLIKKVNGQVVDYFDPGYLFLLFTSLTFLPLSILIIFSSESFFNSLNHWGAFDLNIFRKNIYAHLILILSFSISYYFFTYRTHGKKFVFQKNEKINIQIIVFIFISLAIASIPFNLFNVRGFPRMLMFLIDFMKEPVEIILIGILASKFEKKSSSLIFIFLFSITIYFIPQLLMPNGDAVIINRGKILSVMLVSTGFLNYYKWGGKFLTSKILFYGLLGGLLLIHGLFLLEEYIGGSELTMMSFILFPALAFEPIIFDNAATVINWIDNGEAQLRYGSTWLQALDGLYPFKVNFEPLEEWYCWTKNPSYAATGGRYNFSAVAEGYLNGKLLGVFIHGLIIGSIASFIRGMKYSNTIGQYRLIFYCPSILIVNVLNRKSLMGALGTIEFYLIGITMFVIIYSILNLKLSDSQVS